MNTGPSGHMNSGMHPRMSRTPPSSGGHSNSMVNSHGPTTASGYGNPVMGNYMSPEGIVGGNVMSYPQPAMQKLSSSSGKIPPGMKVGMTPPAQRETTTSKQKNAEKAPFDLSDFPALSGGTGSASTEPEKNQSVPLSEFSLGKEDFPALPGQKSTGNNDLSRMKSTNTTTTTSNATQQSPELYSYPQGGMMYHTKMTTHPSSQQMPYMPSNPNQSQPVRSGYNSYDQSFPQLPRQSPQYQQMQQRQLLQQLSSQPGSQQHHYQYLSSQYAQHQSPQSQSQSQTQSQQQQPQSQPQSHPQHQSQTQSSQSHSQQHSGQQHQHPSLSHMPPSHQSRQQQQQSRSPRQSPVQSPLQSPIQSPLQSPQQSPQQSPIQSPQQSPQQSPEQSPPPPLSAASSSVLGNQTRNQQGKQQQQTSSQTAAAAEMSPTQKTAQQQSNSSSVQNSQYGLLGLLNVIKMTNSDLNTLALGLDLTTLGLNLNSPVRLFPNFYSPFLDKPIRPDLEDFKIPTYYQVSVPPVQTHLGHVTDESLMYIFYNMPRDALQVYAAHELFRRRW
eukprot:CAMPEP_0201497030 /NCGR_PEP_ID=MMETSP0151_2-20130828/63175_1 /ASSEMBLY_ACC=CAM_ASM_000257 /TAXON_ID=200890 /ORGANISM="Paramoeba atlantica, Strain 621/1 / CCAP 1560/9" /LENGTH=553 /DNA_ID=CAMNT_0047887329 /DNA_START=54 /DNA_END=1712 /DNA_ORIENTATION=+